MKGYIQVYTGNGKGKTTAALGIALRAYSANLKTFIGQFTKKGNYSELQTLKLLKDKITIKQYGTENFIFNNPSTADIAAAKEGLAQIKSIISEYDIVILDEINIALYYKLISLDEILDLIQNKPKHVELILTGRYAHDKIIEAADLVTEMKEIKHYYTQGIPARIGIEK